LENTDQAPSAINTAFEIAIIFFHLAPITMPSTLVNLFILILAALGGFYQIYIHPLLKLYGVFDGQVQNIGTRDCYKVEELQTCESEHTRFCCIH
jgi:hypothetical protein